MLACYVIARKRTDRDRASLPAGATLFPNASNSLLASGPPSGPAGQVSHCGPRQPSPPRTEAGAREPAPCATLTPQHPRVERGFASSQTGVDVKDGVAGVLSSRRRKCG
ncbi:hypothetical protein SVAN01_06865 [Stagonosporopsis vannaccii]|nr:hypothetical protein SVAN01_06865 [Stagonosporopsis vannaccii]